jgi:hypothetical protein
VVQQKLSLALWRLTTAPWRLTMVLMGLTMAAFFIDLSYQIPLSQKIK